MRVIAGCKLTRIVFMFELVMDSEVLGVRMVTGIPHWKPPTWLDPDRTSIRNTANHPAIRFALTKMATNS